MLAHAFLAVATADERDRSPAPDGLIMLTVNEFRRLFDALLLGAHRTLACCTGPPGDDDTNTEHADATTSATNHNDHDLRLQY
jgi:hypothetical protein